MIRACAVNRRHFFSRTSLGLGGAALASLLGESQAPRTGSDAAIETRSHGIRRSRSTRRPAASSRRFTSRPRPKRVIYLFMSGGPSQLDLFDYKPLLNQMNGQDLPESVRMGQRLTGMSANQATLPLAGSIFKFARHGQSGAWVSELLPHTARRRRRALLHQLALHRGDQPRPGDHLLPDRLADRRPAVDGVVAQLRPGLGQPEPADVLRPDQPEAARPAALLAALGQRLPAVGAPGRRSSARGPTRCSTSTTRRASRRPAAARCSTGSASCTRWSTTRRSIRRSRPGSPSTRWPTGCRPRCPR